MLRGLAQRPGGVHRRELTTRQAGGRVLQAALLDQPAQKPQVRDVDLLRLLAEHLEVAIVGQRALHGLVLPSVGAHRPVPPVVGTEQAPARFLATAVLLARPAYWRAH